MIQAQKNTKKGFTLIEIMVAVSIFAMVMVVSIGAVLSIVSANRRAQAFNTVLSNLSFALEGMMRDLRTGSNYDCGSTGLPYDCASTPSSRITASSSQYMTQVSYELSAGKIYKTIGTGQPALMTSPDVLIDKLDFYVSGTDTPGSGDFQQPKILIVISGKYFGYGQEGDFNMQTTVSQRKLDI